MTPSPILAVLTGVGMILFGNYLEGGHVSSLVQPTAFLIVMGGTIGATWLAATDDELKYLIKLTPRAVFPGTADRKALLDQLLKVASVVRRDGLLAAEAMIPQIEDDFTRRGLRVLVDGYTPQDLIKLMELDIEITEHHGVAAAKVYETAGGFSPTIGILGAVLGLIHVMTNLGGDVAALGAGIAVAFVATIYGVGFANLIFIPLGNRLKKVVQADVEVKSMALAGLEVIASGANPRQVEEMLAPYVGHAISADSGKEAA